MKTRSLLFLLIFLLFSSSIRAESQEEKRRVEEKKRQNLASSEAPSSSQPAVKLQEMDPIDLIYFTELVGKNIAFRYDICKVVAILMGIEDEYISLDSQITFLNEKKFLPKKVATNFEPTQPLRRGLTAYIFCRVLEIDGGVILRLFGISERYALTELVHQGIMAPGNKNEIISGEELISILMQAANYIAK